MTIAAEPLRLRILTSLVAAPVAIAVVLIGGWLFFLTLLTVFVMMIAEGCRLSMRAEPRGSRVAAIITALSISVIVFVALFMLLWLRADPHDGAGVVLWIIGTVWAADTAAYAAGKIIGGPRLAPRISPGKTWAGFLASLAAAAIAGTVAAAALKASGGLVIISILLALAAQGGDLAESALKRRAGVKDSGTFLPGHGGLLDRADGFLAAVLFAGALAFLRGGETPAQALLSWR